MSRPDPTFPRAEPTFPRAQDSARCVANWGAFKGPDLNIQHSTLPLSWSGSWAGHPGFSGRAIRDSYRRRPAAIETIVEYRDPTLISRGPCFPARTILPLQAPAHSTSTCAILGRTKDDQSSTPAVQMTAP